MLIFIGTLFWIITFVAMYYSMYIKIIKPFKYDGVPCSLITISDYIIIIVLSTLVSFVFNVFIFMLPIFSTEVSYYQPDYIYREPNAGNLLIAYDGVCGLFETRNGSIYDAKNSKICIRKSTKKNAYGLVNSVSYDLHVISDGSYTVENAPLTFNQYEVY